MTRVSLGNPRVPSTKRRPPALPPDFISRPRVHERLTEGRGRRLMLVCAPAGFGKTIALAGWLHGARRAWVWVSLDELDRDLVSFTGVLVAALGTVVHEPGPGPDRSRPDRYPARVGAPSEGRR
jgi:LuxR family transcriptional regulator, maltose regulon positive regulatory protein